MSYFNDFVIFSSKLNTNNFSDNYTHNKKINGCSIYYKPNNIFPLFQFVNEQSCYINIYRSFTSLFRLKTKDMEIITPNFENIIACKEEFSINETAIKEFILFNTPLNKNTFFNEVERLINIKKIIINRGGITFEEFIKEENSCHIFEVITEKISCNIKKLISFRNGILLSGGNESRINAAISSYYDLNRSFFTWGHPKDKEFIIAKKVVDKIGGKHINLSLNPSDLPYKDYLQKSGFISNMQYAYRYKAAQLIADNYDIDVLWTGWADNIGYSFSRQPNELFSSFYLKYINDDKIENDSGWSLALINESSFNNYQWLKPKRGESFYDDIFKIINKYLAPPIFGQMLTIENFVIPIYAPFFDFEIYRVVDLEESLNSRLIEKKRDRVIWKGDLYHRILKKYDNRLNFLKNSKGFYPILLNKWFSTIGLPLAALLKCYEERKNYPFDPTEDTTFLKNQLYNILDFSYEFFDKKQIEYIINISSDWKKAGIKIHEIVKLIQVFWLFEFSKNKSLSLNFSK